MSAWMAHGARTDAKSALANACCLPVCLSISHLSLHMSSYSSDSAAALFTLFVF